MKETLKNLFNKYLWLIALIGVLAIGAALYKASGWISESLFNSAIESNQTQNQTFQNEAANANSNAANFSVERRTEDAVRERVIKPKLEAARRNSQTSKADLEAAKQKLNETEKNLHNVNASRAANCAELKSLFPVKRFEYCQ